MQDLACPLHNCADAHFAKQQSRMKKETLHQIDDTKLHVKVVCSCKASHIISTLKL